MRHRDSKCFFIIVLIIYSLFSYSCKERIPDWYIIDFNRCIKGNVLSLGGTSPINDATIRIWIVRDTLNPLSGSYKDTLVFKTDANGYYQTPRISEKLWQSGQLVIEASKTGWETATWKSSLTYKSEYDPLAEIWSRDDNDTLYVSFGLQSLYQSFAVSPEVLYFGNNLTTLPLYIFNTGAGMLNWVITVSDKTVIYNSHDKGQLMANQFFQEFFSVDRSVLTSGTYSFNIVISTIPDTVCEPVTVPAFVTVD